MNKNIFFDIIVKWINNFISSNNEEMKEIKKIFGEKINIFSYFKYLVANCNIINKVIETFNKIKEFQKYFTISFDVPKDKYLKLKLKIDFDLNQNKGTAKKSSGESLFNLGKELVEKINKKNISNLFEKNYKIYFYFNEKEEKFCETCSDIDLNEFIYNKVQSLKNFSIRNINDNFRYLKEENLKEETGGLLFINNKLKEKNILFLFSEIYNIEIKEEKQKKEIINIVNSFLEENQNLIASFFQETAEKCNQPNDDDCYYLIYNKINEIIFSSLEPCFSLNLKLNNSFIKEKKYNYIINLDEIINSIRGTKYHLDPKLNSLFQIKAINYIINDNSNFSIFIFELYNALLKKREKNKIEFKEKEEHIKEKFSIKIEKGKKYTKNDFDILQKKKAEKSKKIKEIKDIKKRPLKHNERVQYKLGKYDTDVQYNDNFFPFESIYYYKGKKLKNQEFITFHDYIVYYKGKKHNFNHTNNFINVYDLIFTVKKIDKNNIITLEQNDISEILVHYSDKDMFNSLLNQNFSSKTDEELEIDITPIKLYLKGKKFI